MIDLRDVIDRFEAIEDSDDEDEKAEAATLRALLDECQGNGGDAEWRGAWYPVTLVRDSYFVEYAQELADEIGAIDRDAKWPCNHIDWDAAARDLRQDYTSIDFDGVTYLTRQHLPARVAPRRFAAGGGD